MMLENIFVANIFVRSSAEKEFKAMTQGICEEVLWMNTILDDLKIKYEGPMILHCDDVVLSSDENGRKRRRMEKTDRNEAFSSGDNS